MDFFPSEIPMSGSLRSFSLANFSREGANQTPSKSVLFLY